MSDSNLKTILDFLGKLERNNNKPWFERHREDYEAAKAGFENFVTGLIHGIDEFDDVGGLAAKDCIMRIYRDVRFSKDKSPYKASFAAHIKPGGKRSARLGYYLHLAPRGGTLAGGGLYMPEPAQLAAFRAVVAGDARPFKKILAGKDFKKQLGEMEGEALKTAPKGYPADHPEIELLKLKQILASRKFSDQEVLAPGFPKQMLAAFKALKPFLDYLTSITS